MKLWVVALCFVVVVMGYLALAPTGDGSYRCDRPPLQVLVDPFPERPDAEFFDEGTQCNADARHRARKLLGLVVLGGSTVAALLVIERRRDAEPPVS